MAVLAGGYAINKLTADHPSPGWWVLAVVSVVVLVTSGLWKVRIEKLHRDVGVAARAETTTASSAARGDSNNVTSMADSNDTTIENSDVSVSANNHSLAAWEVNGTVYLGGSAEPQESDRSADLNGEH
ncbi:hypothetical protein H7J08_12425 [Mycobacterium frederiksbergense]|uniref:hypothetical protein n=1 Tax=Mycolicibacterium frederiksbergense TaxID=117567 RepID=UPI0021F3BF29|nr:hypothetical protein [Mycolicibacterium frederiksbergense]MCV7045472.1 hypothetical protein [Mycolicibacterium frederiksbergense]